MNKIIHTALAVGLLVPGAAEAGALIGASSTNLYHGYICATSLSTGETHFIRQGAARYVGEMGGLDLLEGGPMGWLWTNGVPEGTTDVDRRAGSPALTSYLVEHPGTMVDGSLYVVASTLGTSFFVARFDGPGQPPVAGPNIVTHQKYSTATPIVPFGDELVVVASLISGTQYRLCRINRATLDLEILNTFPDSSPLTILATPSGILFAGASGSDRELWITDGTVAGTRLLSDLNSTGSSWPTGFVAVGDDVYFTAIPSASTRVLYRMDSEGNIEPVWTPNASILANAPILPVNGRLVLRPDGSSGLSGNLYSVDPTDWTSVLLSHTGSPDDPAGPGFRIYTHPRGIDDWVWRTDGTPEGTTYLGVTTGGIPVVEVSPGVYHMNFGIVPSQESYNTIREGQPLTRLFTAAELPKAVKTFWLY